MRTSLCWIGLAVMLLSGCEEATQPEIRRALNESILAWQKDDAATAFAILDRTIATYDVKKYRQQMEAVHKLRQQYEAQYRDHYAAERSYYGNRHGVAGAIYDEIVLYHRQQQRYPEHLNELEVFNSLPAQAREFCEYEKAALFEAGFILHCYGSSVELETHAAATGHPTIWSRYESQQIPTSHRYAPAPDEPFALDSGLQTPIRAHDDGSSILDDFCIRHGQTEEERRWLPPACPNALR